MTDTEKQNIVNTYNDILNKYSEFITNNQDGLNNTSNLDATKLFFLRENLLEFYNKFSDLEIETSKCRYLNNNREWIQIEGNRMTLSDLNEVVKTLLNRISLKYIYPITLQLGGLDNKKAKRRDYKLFACSILISSFISVLTTWYFDRGNDNDLENYSKIIINQQKNDSIMIRQNSHILRENRAVLDSLKLRRK